MGLEKQIAALFDFDGVVADTEKQYSEFWNTIGNKYHENIVDFGKIIKGQTLTQIFNTYFKDQISIQQEITTLLNAFENKMSFDYIPGVYDVMKQLRNDNVKIAIVTSSNDLKMKNAFKAHPELMSIIDLIITADMISQSKPNPECFLLGSKKFNIPPANCVVFEDSFHGLQAGKAAGMKVVGLATTNSREDIIEKADMVIDDFIGFSIKDII